MMPLQNVKNPDKFPPAYLNAIQEGLGRRMIWHGGMEAMALREQRRFNALRRSLKAFSAHSLSQVVNRFEVRTFRRKTDVGTWELWLEISVPREESWELLEKFERDLL